MLLLVELLPALDEELDELDEPESEDDEELDDFDAGELLDEEPRLSFR